VRGGGEGGPVRPINPLMSCHHQRPVATITSPGFPPPRVHPSVCWGDVPLAGWLAGWLAGGGRESKGGVVMAELMMKLVGDSSTPRGTDLS